jgi:hypothetical protein
MSRTQYSIFENEETKKAFKEKMMTFIINCLKPEVKNTLILVDSDSFDQFSTLVTSFMVSYNHF